MIAALNGHEQVARVLLEAGAAVDQTEEGGSTALMFAAFAGEQVLATRLLAARALSGAARRVRPPAVFAMGRSSCGEESFCFAVQQGATDEIGATSARGHGRGAIWHDAATSTGMRVHNMKWCRVGGACASAVAPEATSWASSGVALGLAPALAAGITKAGVM